MIRAFAAMNLDRDKTVIVSGIGCSSRAAGYLDFNTLHTTHGRAPAFATGIKLANPELTVFVLMGDGDATAIGGNHFIHAARRNIDLTAIVFNNSIYGMTGGQHSPLTPPGRHAATAPYGTCERPFDLAELARAAGATYIGRGTTYHAALLSKLIAEGAGHKGFAVIEAVSACPTSYGRQNKMGDGYRMLMRQKENAIPAAMAAKLPPEELNGKIVIGRLFQGDAPEYTEVAARQAKQAAGG
ncbi:MAG: 2-oxoglutarate ferredoxin oxidoreductase subunit beta [Peptococcaceae bacterium]|nr:2-oxoglutarate ferredoxin oxidoreductase subunit beta [Peptococcaceae bacterium]